MALLISMKHKHLSKVYTNLAYRVHCRLWSACKALWGSPKILDSNHKMGQTKGLPQYFFKSTRSLIRILDSNCYAELRFSCKLDLYHCSYYNPEYVVCWHLNLWTPPSRVLTVTGTWELPHMLCSAAALKKLNALCSLYLAVTMCNSCLSYPTGLVM